MTVAVSVILLVACAVALAILARAIGTAGRPPASRFERALAGRPRPAPARLDTLGSLESAVSLGLAGGREFDRWLAPILRDAAAARLAVRRGFGLERAEAARRLLGDETWELLRPDRARPEAGSPAPSAAELRRAIEAIEGL
jgi:hypothetical protein